MGGKTGKCFWDLYPFLIPGITDFGKEIFILSL